MSRPCARCGNARDIKVYFGRRVHPYCKKCHAAYQRDHRKRVPLTPDERRKDIARSYAGQYLKRGKIERKPCADCGDTQAQMHHHDYSKPLEVEWLCRPCHLRHHYGEEHKATKRSGA